MQDPYIYRHDKTHKLKAFLGDCHRAPRWRGGPDSYPHNLLGNRLNLLSSTQGIYRICFWTDLNLALKEVHCYPQPWANTHTIARCRKSDVMTKGFTDSWDDGLPLGQAHLFWIEENLSSHNEDISTAAIPFGAFEAYVNGNWIPLADHIFPVTAPTAPGSTVRSEVSTRRRFHWLKSIFGR